NADRSGLRQITPGSDAQPHWSPDGRRVLYTEFTGLEGQTIRVLDVATGQARRLAAHPGCSIARWTPEGDGRARAVRGRILPRARTYERARCARAGLPLKRLSPPWGHSSRRSC